MPETNTPRLPIGSWLKKADELLTARINEAQEANGLSRTEWQILNVLYEMSAASPSEIVDVLKPFADASRLEAMVDALMRHGLIEAEGPETARLRLTQQGRSLHAAALEIQKAIRERAMRGITEDDYLTTIRVLQTMVANLSESEGEQPR